MLEMGAVEDEDEREDVMWGVMRWEPRPREGRVSCCWAYVVVILVKCVGELR